MLSSFFAPTSMKQFDRSKVAALVGIPALLAVLWFLYSPSFSYRPILDDVFQIDHTQKLETFASLLRTDAAGLFRPIKNLIFSAFMSDYETMRTFGFLLFGVQTVTIFLFLSRFFPFVFSYLATILYALHPAQVSTITFPVAYNNILCAVGVFGFLYFADRRITGEDKSKANFAAIAFMGSLALISYELGVVILPLLFLLWLIRRNGPSTTAFVPILATTILIVIFYLGVRTFLSASTTLSHSMIPPSTTSLDLMKSAPFYTLKHMWISIYPFQDAGILIIDDPADRSSYWVTFWIVLATASLLSLTFLIRDRSVFAFGFLFFVVSMIPLSNWIPLRNGPICNYYLLIPLFGSVLVFAELMRSARMQRSKSVLFVLFALLFITFTIETKQRVQSWRDLESISLMSLQSNPLNYVAWNNLSSALMDREQFPAAKKAAEQAVDLAPWYPEPRENLIWIELKLGNFDQVLHWFDSLSDHDPDLGAAAIAALVFTNRNREAQTLVRQVKRHPLSSNGRRVVMAVRNQPLDPVLKRDLIALLGNKNDP